MNIIKIFSKLLFLPIISCLLKPPKISNIPLKQTDVIIDNWVDVLKANKSPIYNLFPLYSVSGRINKTLLKHDQDKVTHIEDIIFKYEYFWWVGKPTELPPSDGSFISHICVCSLGSNKTLYVEQLIMNPDSLIDNQKLFIQSSVQFRDDFEKYGSRHNFTIQWGNMSTWDNGRYKLLLNEDKILK